jgi:hypothetical protein
VLLTHPYGEEVVQVSWVQSTLSEQGSMALSIETSAITKDPPAVCSRALEMNRKVTLSPVYGLKSTEIFCQFALSLVKVFKVDQLPEIPISTVADNLGERTVGVVASSKKKSIVNNTPEGIVYTGEYKISLVWSQEP